MTDIILTIIGIVGLVFGAGFSIPAYCAARFFPRKKNSMMPELEFLADWLLLQCVMGWITIFAVPVAFWFFPAMVIANVLGWYLIVSVASGCFVGLVFFNNKML
jgi:hypothetical protein